MLLSRLTQFATRHLQTIKRNLPKPPVPSLEHTLDRYLEYAAVVAAGSKTPLHKTHEAAQQFRVVGQQLQEQLQTIAMTERNWVNRFWLPEMYLRIRLPVPVNSSPAYIFPLQQFDSTEDMIRYTALLVRGMVDYKSEIDAKGVEREMSTGRDKVFMCMEQYERILSCYRHPALGEDIQVKKAKTNKTNEHVLVMCRNQAFVVHTRIGGELLPYADIAHQLMHVRRRARTREDVALPIGGCSSGDRETAARFWNEMLTVEQNEKSLQWAKEALFVVCLDDATGEKLSTQEEGMVLRGKHLLHGFGSRRCGFNRWYDATIQLIVSEDGSSGLCIEHSTAEGIVIINMAESAIRFERENRHRNLMSRKERQILPKPLTWHLSHDAMMLMEKQRETFDELASELELEVMFFYDYGKEFIKSKGISPDGYIQLAMQLAHFKQHGYLVSTYESASIRRFGAGRVDNIRANTQQALEWITAMTCNKISKEKRRELMLCAAKKQAQVTCENITGEGIDNHLCALFVIAREAVESGKIAEMPALFTDPLWNEVMRFPLSTSQVTTSSDVADSYLCYGAVVRDGYGCAYNIQKNHLLFSPSAFKSNKRTNLKQFKASLREALLDMQQLLS